MDMKQTLGLENTVVDSHECFKNCRLRSQSASSDLAKTINVFQVAKQATHLCPEQIAITEAGQRSDLVKPQETSTKASLANGNPSLQKLETT